MQKKFGYGMRDIFSRHHSLLRHSRCLPETLHCPKKAVVQPFIPIHCLPRIKSWLKIAKIKKTEKVTKNRRTFLHTVEF